MNRKLHKEMQRYLISASEDKEIYVYSLARGDNYKRISLEHHEVRKGATRPKKFARYGHRSL